MILHFFVCALLFGHAFSSRGDKSPAFIRCTNSCTQNCPPQEGLNKLLFGCVGECSYQCMTQLTIHSLQYSDLLEEGISNNDNREQPSRTKVRQLQSKLLGKGGSLEGLLLGKQVQFYGKWPFTRHFQMQEPLSVLFSILNFLAHYNGWKQLSKLRPHLQTTTLNPSSVSRLKHEYMALSIVGMNAWIWSAVFHTRDVSWTERADYISAGLLVGYQLFSAISRTTGLYNCSSPSIWIKLMRIGVCGGLGVVYARHAWRLLTRPRIDYGANMAFNVIVGISTLLIWTAWCLYLYLIPNNHKSLIEYLGPLRLSHPLTPLVPLLSLPILSTLELLDFPPWPNTISYRLLDAHSLWHAATAPVAYAWYKWLVWDLKNLSGARVVP